MGSLTATMLERGFGTVQVSGMTLVVGRRVLSQMWLELTSKGVTACALVWQVIKATVVTEGRSAWMRLPLRMALEERW